jgi:putative membrane protein
LENKDKLFLPIIGGLTLAVLAAISVLFYLPLKGTMNVSLLPRLNAILNSSTAVALVLGFIFVKNGNIKMHRFAMFLAFTLSTMFLVSYVLYHANAQHTVFPTDNSFKYVYYLVLLTHILLSIVVVPLVLSSIYFGITNQIEKHKKVVKYTFPIWLYVSITGVIVYIMISPYYQF